MELTYILTMLGGEMLEAEIVNMKAFGRVTICGVISEYIDAGKRSSPNTLDVVYKRITIRGFLVANFMNVFADFFAKTLYYLGPGKLEVINVVNDGWRFMADGVAENGVPPAPHTRTQPRHP